MSMKSMKTLTNMWLVLKMAKKAKNKGIVVDKGGGEWYIKQAVRRRSSKAGRREKSFEKAENNA